MSILDSAISIGFILAAKAEGRFVAADPDASPFAETDPNAMPPEMVAPQFPVGSAVHDFVSGLDGTVMEYPAGSENGKIAFVKFDGDEETHPTRVDQLEMKNSPALAEAVPLPEAVADQGPPAAEGTPAVPVATKASLTLAAGAKSGILATEVMGDGAAGSGNDQTYGEIFAACGAKIMASRLLELFGYVPKKWDALVAALEKDGVRIFKATGLDDIAVKAGLGLNEREILAEACAAHGAVAGETRTRFDVLKASQVLARRQDAARRLNLAKLHGGVPTKPQPTDPAPEGMVYAWNDQQQDWYLKALQPDSTPAA